MKKLLEMAGVNEHLNKETKLFNEVCASLEKLKTFCDSCDKPAYTDIKKSAAVLCDKLTKHLDRYK